MGTQSHCPASLPSLCGTSKSYRHVTTISKLPENVLTEIFDFYRSFPFFPGTWKWHVLAHVCRTWRQVVFASPRRLHLQIHCTYGTPVRKNLGIWPPFPIAIDYPGRCLTPNDEDNVIATLKHPDRVCFVRLCVTGSQLERVATVMQEPFPVLTHLQIRSRGGNASVLPAEFLGGSARCLQTIDLKGIPFPTLPTFLLSASGLVSLNLYKIPPTGYISPEAIVACVAALPQLHTFTFAFQSHTSRPDRIRPPPLTRAVLPALTYFYIKGAIQYLEDLVARIDCPQLKWISIHYLNQFVGSQVTQIAQFIHRTVGHWITPSTHANVLFSRDRVIFDLNDRHCGMAFFHKKRYWQVSHMTQVLIQFSATLSDVVHLELGLEDHQLQGTGDVEWLHLLHQFSTVQVLHVSPKLAGHVARVLENITGAMIAEVLPSLRLICLEDQLELSIEKFVAARRLSGRPVIVINRCMGYIGRRTAYSGGHY
ncbi:hypothetical protein EDB89DRAFT_2230720 [Lactarius sanguifluus]|nr:hypothetical protein EDB89DRAFT_2230720 [Lactarius sanguifluus]